MENPTILITFHRDTLALDIDAPDLTLDVIISLMQRALRALENQEKVFIAHQISASVRQLTTDEARTQRVLSRVKLQ